MLNGLLYCLSIFVRIAVYSVSGLVFTLGLLANGVFPVSDVGIRVVLDLALRVILISLSLLFSSLLCLLC